MNLALDATENEREKSLELDVGYHPLEKEWDLIIKYSGDLSEVRALSVRVAELMNEYAVIRIAQSRIGALAEIAQVEYIEKPKRLFFETENGKRVSCINEVQGTRFSLSGQGVLVAVIDSGIDFENRDFRNPDGTTRIRSLWDQSLIPRAGEAPPKDYPLGVEYSQQQINEALEKPSSVMRRQLIASTDTSGHGTAVAGIAAGSGGQAAGGSAGAGSGTGHAVNAGVRGVAPESELLVVKMGNPSGDGFPRTAELMMGIDYAVRKALEYQKPVAVNISFGNTYGAHNGASLLERYIDDVSNIWKSCICIGTGNEAAGAGHASGRLGDPRSGAIQLAVQENQPALSVQIWKEYVDVVNIAVESPSGERIGPVAEVGGTQRYRVGMTELLLYYGEPSPYSAAQEIYMDFLPVENYIQPGVWTIELIPEKIVSGNYELWLPSESVLNRGTGFLLPSKELSLTIPSTAGRAVSVGAYDARTFAYADFSGRGYVGSRGNVKPDLAAPGVDVITSAAGGGTVTVSGTSFAAPFVTGSAALLMEWGIVRGNDPFLYGEKVKAYLRRGARPLPGFTEYPNNQVGYGALCVAESLPG